MGLDVSAGIQLSPLKRLDASVIVFIAGPLLKEDTQDRPFAANVFDLPKQTERGHKRVLGPFDPTLASLSRNHRPV